MSATRLTDQQQEQLDYLMTEYGIEPDQVKWFESGDPWLSSKALIKIARFSGLIKEITKGIDKTIPEFSQVAHFARAVDREGFSLQLVGVAAISEPLWNGEIADEHELAGSRALVNVLDAFGVNPLKGTQKSGTPAEQHRLKQIKEIHALARDCGLITEDEEGLQVLTAYRDFLAQWSLRAIGRVVTTSVALDQLGRASLISALREYKGARKQ